MIRLRALWLAPLAVAPWAMVACATTASGPPSASRDGGDPFAWLDDEPYEEDDPLDQEPTAPIFVDRDAATFGTPASSRPADDAGAPRVDAGPPVDAGPVGTCVGPLAAGDLRIVELTVAARAGSGDDGEWIEVQSTRECSLDVSGVRVESPRGTLLDAATLPAGTVLPPFGRFVAAGTADFLARAAIPGLTVAFGTTDILKNDGDTVRVVAGAAVLDALDYPRFSNLEPGRSLAFPADCAASHRATWERWSLAFSSFGQGLRGTPNAPNTDVRCF